MNRAELIAAMAAAVPKPIEVPIPELGTSVFIRALSVADIDNRAGQIDDPENKYRCAITACHVMCDENGDRLFDAANLEDVQLIASQSWDWVQRVILATNKMNGVEAAKNG